MYGSRSTFTGTAQNLQFCLIKEKTDGQVVLENLTDETEVNKALHFIDTML